MFKEIYVPFDNSEFSFRAMEIGLGLANGCGATLVGSHVYAAKLHDDRFRTMESGLPEEFRKESQLEAQRDIHDSLITNGLELITDSYLSVMAERCTGAGVPFRGVSLEGRNWNALTVDINEQSYDLVVMGAHGLGRTPESLVGTVCDRVVRRVKADVLIVRDPLEPAAEAPIVVCLDGSSLSWGALELGFALSQQTGRPLRAISSFDPYFHYAVFESLKNALTERAKGVFKFEQQEQLHEQIIDSGLAKIYQSYLDIALKMAEAEELPLEIKLLDGKASEKVSEYARLHRPWLVIMGRTGIHGGEELDMGGVTEHMLRLSPSNLLLTNREARPPLELEAEATMAWTEEAKAMLDKAPAMVKGVATAAIQRFALAQGYTMITSTAVEEALEQLLPPQARLAMGIGMSKEARDERLDGSFSLTFACPSCGYLHARKRPESCPVCKTGGSRFRVEAAEDKPAENTEQRETFDGISLGWAPEALDELDQLPDDLSRTRARQKIEKKARGLNKRTITGEFVRATLAPAGEDQSPAKPAEGNGAGGSSPSSDTSETATSATPGGEAPHADGGAAAVEERSAEKGDPAGSDGNGQPPWDEAGWARLLRAPEGFMRDRARASVEAYAREIGAEAITLEVAEAGMAKARDEMMNSVE